MPDRLDCFRMLAEMHKAGVNNSEVARRLGLPRMTIHRWKEGTEPGYTHGKRLVELHAYVTSGCTESLHASP